jgi:hypothetical protein
MWSTGHESHVKTNLTKDKEQQVLRGTWNCLIGCCSGESGIVELVSWNWGLTEIRPIFRFGSINNYQPILISFYRYTVNITHLAVHQ